MKFNIFFFLIHPKFCGNDPKTMLKAALIAESHYDAVDVNIGCPQAIAKRGRYGSYLQDDWDLLRDIGIPFFLLNLIFSFLSYNFYIFLNI